MLTLEVSQKGLLVEAGGLETERVNNVVDLDRLVFEGLLSLLGGGVGTDVWKESHVRTGVHAADLGARKYAQESEAYRLRRHPR